MDDNKQPIAEVDDSKARAELLENSGMGAPAEEPAEEAAPADESKPEPKPKKPTAEEDDEAEDESEEEEDEAEESEDDEEADEDGEEGEEDEEPEIPKNPARTVPYSLLKAKNAKIKALEAQLAEKGDKDAPEGEDEDDVDAAAEALAKELGADDVDKTRLTKILKAAVALAAKKGGPVVLPKEVQDKLRLLDKYEAESKEKSEQQHFDKEWSALLPSISKQYPGVTPAILAEAAKLMDELSHTKKFHDKDLDYVLFKNRNKFDAILKVAPKNKGGEAGKTMQEQDIEEGDEEQLTDIENLTPDIMKQREGRSTDAKLKHRDYKVQHPIR